MVFAPPVTRRLLLRRFAAGTSVFGTFLLPPALHGAMAGQQRHRHHGSEGSHSAEKDTARSRSRHPDAGGAKPPVPLVMLDPGHGGKDPGAIGVSGTYEKQVSLATAMELKRQLEASGRYRVELTRAKDVFIPLDDRVDRAQRHGAALFVSMHADALSDHSVRGASVYTLAQTASDAQTAALARTENSADRFLGGRWQGTSPEVSRILASLVRQETRTGSVRIARSLVGSLDQDLPMLQNPDRHAGFVVLKAADIPSVLVEMGFMSNPRDEAALRRPDHRKLVAEAMHRAVDAYFAGFGHMADGTRPGIG
ncbi:MAG: N-acetylmuramoyl-L-alanine amidase [Acetobacteraceae bacterium]|jgi:N-acetylmuramoyl-L-alanine amidase|nr:N-acetylmuramoyl-L-alanine amidase [Rhodopila sp.]MEA2732696.1 N-acetylmuramoyl-L-alanine amidase [Acetobacteraceae bacterium]MEA2771100.1 N-acetylmuramoyl-L-alanine amidase [Acetobacteraceae bacterium]